MVICCLFHPAFIKIKNIVDEGKIGEIQYIYSNRLNWVVLEMMRMFFGVLRLMILVYLIIFLNESPLNVFSNGVDILQKGCHDTSITSFKYNGKRMGHIFVSWLHPFKEHRFVINWF